MPDDTQSATEPYLVDVREIHVSTRRVFATSPEDAIERALDGDSEEVLCEYSETLGKDTWTAKREHDK